MAYIKVIRSGNLIEEWSYERTPVERPYKEREKREKRPPRERRDKDIKACKKAFQRLVRANLDVSNPPVLVTLTMAEIEPIEVAYKKFTQFGAKLRRKFGGSLKYIAVPEFQKRGAVHFHVLMFGLSNEYVQQERRTRFIAKLWGWGFVDTVKTDGNARLSSYLAKYMSKAMHDKRLIGKRAYSASRNVARPELLNTPLQIEAVFLDWGVGVDNSATVVQEYDTLYLGRCVYKQFIV